MSCTESPMHALAHVYGNTANSDGRPLANSDQRRTIMVAPTVSASNSNHNTNQQQKVVAERVTATVVVTEILVATATVTVLSGTQ